MNDQIIRLLFIEDNSSDVRLLTDVIMPGGLNGPELAERLYTLRPELKVLFISGHPNQAIIHYGVLAPGLFFYKNLSPRLC